MSERIDIAVLRARLEAFLAEEAGNVFLWHDADGSTTREDLPAFADGVELVCEDDFDSRFELLRRVNAATPERRVLLVRRCTGGVCEGDWFADIEARAVCFERSEAFTADVAPEPPVLSEPTGKTSDGATVHSESPVFSAENLTQKADILAELQGSPQLEKHPPEDSHPKLPQRAVLGPAPAPSLYDAYFSEPLVSHDVVPESVRNAAGFKRWLKQAQAAAVLLDYDKDTWITLAGMSDLGISSSSIIAFLDDVCRAVSASGISYVTVPWLRQHASEVPLMDYELPNAFYESALCACNPCPDRCTVMGTRLFRMSPGRAQPADLVAAIVIHERSVQAHELLDILEADYGIRVTRTQLGQYVRHAKLFFRKELDRIYQNHDQFVEEME